MLMKKTTSSLCLLAARCETSSKMLQAYFIGASREKPKYAFCLFQLMANFGNINYCQKKKFGKDCYTSVTHFYDQLMSFLNPLNHEDKIKMFDVR